MCGIIGVSGVHDAPEVIIEALRRLEYRGYDSAGMTIYQDGMLKRVREATGTNSVELLSKHIKDFQGSDSISGLGHNRWATHGRPSQENAHPHFDCSGRVAVVHNGIVENFRELKEELLSDGHVFSSETDTEVIAHLLEVALIENGRIDLALAEVFSKLRGAMAIVAMETFRPTLLACVRRTSPLIIATSDGEGYIASDIPAILGRAKHYYQIDDGVVATVELGEISAFQLDHQAVEPREFVVTWDLSRAARDGYDDFMSKEIMEQPQAIRDTLAGRLPLWKTSGIKLDELRLEQSQLLGVNKIFMIGCGTSYHACMAARYAIESLCKIPVELDVASEFRYREPKLDPQTLVIAVSQSGETLDTIAALTEASNSGAISLVVSNVVDSSMARIADAVIYTHAGPEVCVASTKTYLAQIVALELFAIYFAKLRGTSTLEEIQTLATALADLPDKVEKLTNRFSEMVQVASKVEAFERFYFIGRNVGFPVALEGALKLKELSYLPAEGFPAGELKHGPIAMLDPSSVVVAIATRGRLWEKVMANLQEVKARGARVLLVANEGDQQTIAEGDAAFQVPKTHPLLSPVLDTIPLQVLAYHLARFRGFDVDRPRNLAKTVTVE